MNYVYFNSLVVYKLQFLSHHISPLLAHRHRSHNNRYLGRFLHRPPTLPPPPPLTSRHQQIYHQIFHCLAMHKMINY